MWDSRYMGRSGLLVGVVALLTVSCSSGGEGGGDASTASSGNGVVAVASVQGSDVLVDSEGRTLYTAEAEQGGQILCVDACTAFWEPVLASTEEAGAASEELGMQLGLVDRPDGESQLTLSGLPLYTFTEEDAGQLDGDGFVDDFQGTRFEWEAARSAGAADPTGPDTGDDASGNVDY
jgi:predicted lipoprotein with Yx(FWY)xxD motif